MQIGPPGLEAVPPGERLAAFESIAAAVRVCTLCPLHQGRKNAVPGEGPVDSVIAFIGEAPGAEEDLQGRPFVGRSGQLLRRTIVESGWKESEVFIGNVLKCRPPGNRDPLDTEIACCRHYLEAQLGLIRPRLIVTLGRYSMGLLIDPKLKITQVRGKLIQKSGLLFVPTFHPAAVLRSQSLLPDFRRDVFLSLKKARELAEAQPDAKSALAGLSEDSMQELNTASETETPAVGSSQPEREKPQPGKPYTEGLF